MSQYRCDRCNCPRVSVTHTRAFNINWQGRNKLTLRRRRVCDHCGYVWYTVEISEEEMEQAESQRSG